MSQDVIYRVAAKYGVSIASFGPVEGGYRNTSHSFTTTDGRALNFILYKRESESIPLIMRSNELGLYVFERGLPVRAPVDKRILRVGDRYGSLYSYIQGETIPWEAYTMKHIKLVGFALARFHAAAKDFTEELPSVEDVYVAINHRMQQYFSDTHVVGAIREKLQLKAQIPDFTALLDSMKKLPGRQPLHMDFVRSNLLFRDARPNDVLTVGHVSLSGILDLEKAAYGHPLFDIARTLAFLLVDCSKPADKVYKYFLHSGYSKRGGGTWVLFDHDSCMFCDGWAFPAQRGDTGWQIKPSEPEQNRRLSCSSLWLEALVTMFLTYDLYKFLKQNPYESLQENHHFIRTVAMLRVRKVVQ